jgi:hypothetical protein
MPFIRHYVDESKKKSRKDKQNRRKIRQLSDEGKQMLLSATTKIEPFQDLLKPNANRSRSAEDSFELSKQLGTLPASTLQQLPKKPDWGGLDKKQAWQLKKAAAKARQIKNRGVKRGWTAERNWASRRMKKNGDGVPPFNISKKI